MIQIQSKKQGAELTSILVDGKEILHDGKEYWQRQTPVLFPIVGQLKNGECKIYGETYKMGQHGFARDMEFEEIEKSNNIHKYLLKSNISTLNMFPFKFELYVTHKIYENTVITEYKVINTDNKEMFFGLGSHPAFKCEYSTGEYILEFEKEEKDIELYKLENGLLSTNQFIGLIKNNKYIELKEDTFKEDAIIMKNIKSNKVILKNKKNNKEILEFDFSGFPYLAIWSKRGAPFVCIESWFNTTDKIDSDGIFENKENILKLKPNEEFKCEYVLRFKEEK